MATYIGFESLELCIIDPTRDTTFYLREKINTLDAIRITNRRQMAKLESKSSGPFTDLFTVSQTVTAFIIFPVKGSSISLERFAMKLGQIKPNSILQYSCYKRDTLGYWIEIKYDSIKVKNQAFVLSGVEYGRLNTNEIAGSVFLPESCFWNKSSFALKGRYTNSDIKFQVSYKSDPTFSPTKNLGRVIKVDGLNFIPSFKLTYKYD